MKNWAIFKPIVAFYNMFFNNDTGFSMRKWLTVFAVYAAYVQSLRLKDEKLILESSNLWLVAAGIFIGLIAIPDLIKVVVALFTKTPPSNISPETKQP